MTEDTYTPTTPRPDAAPAMLDSEMLAAIRKRVKPQPVPPCPVCGSDLDIGAIGGGKVTYRCSSITLDTLIPIGAPGWSEQRDHIRLSHHYVRLPDPDLITLLDHIDAQAATIAALVEALERIQHDANYQHGPGGAVNGTVAVEYMWALEGCLRHAATALTAAQPAPGSEGGGE